MASESPPREGNEELNESIALTLLARGVEPAAANELFALLYAELHRLAEAHLRRQGRVLTLGATTLVHEVYERMVGPAEVSFSDRARFFAYASRAMRGVVIDYARRRFAQKRGQQITIAWNEHEQHESAASHDAESALIGLRDALDELTALDENLAELVDIHFFGGLTFAEIADLRGVSERTVQRDWQKARMLLKRALREHDSLLSASEDGPHI